MTWSAKFEVTEVKDGHVRAVASVEDGTLNQNTEHATGAEILFSLEDGVEPKIKVGDVITGSGHFDG